MVSNRIAKRFQRSRKFGQAVLKTIRTLKDKAIGERNGPISKVLHEMEGKMLRAAGIVAKGGKRSGGNKRKAKKTG